MQISHGLAFTDDKWKVIIKALENKILLAKQAGLEIYVEEEIEILDKILNQLTYLRNTDK